MADTINPVLEAFKIHEHFCKALLDAYAVIDAHGKVLKSNPLLSQLTGLSSKQILKLESFSDILQFQIAGEPLQLSRLLESQIPTRIDEVRCTNASGNELNCILGVYPFIKDGEHIGAFILLRDVTAETALQDKYKDKATQSITDNLTRLYNRSYFEDYLKQQDKHLLTLPVNSDHRKMSVIMADIDHFKKVNDVHGHPAGDYVIKTVAGFLMQSLRKTDVICRYGGEEFLMILPSSDLAGASQAAEKIRKNVEGHRFEFEGKHIPLTISSGVAQIIVGQESAKETVARADAALYYSKHNGRNRVSLHTGTTIGPASEPGIVPVKKTA